MILIILVLYNQLFLLLLLFYFILLFNYLSILKINIETGLFLMPMTKINLIATRSNFPRPFSKEIVDSTAISKSWFFVKIAIKQNQIWYWPKMALNIGYRKDWKFKKYWGCPKVYFLALELKSLRQNRINNYLSGSRSREPLFFN